MGESPKVSVILPTYNRAALLPRAVNSVLAQTYTDFELLIVDDCSSDDTPQVIAEFADPRIRPFRQGANRGASAARNLGIGKARGEHLAFLDDDNEFTPDSLAVRVAALESAPPEVALVYGWNDHVDDATGDRQPANRLTLEDAEAFEYALMLRTVAPPSAFLVRRDAARDVGGFEERITFGEDGHFVCCILSKYRISALPTIVNLSYVNHGSARLSDRLTWDIDSRWVAHVERFASELQRRPKRHAALLRTRAVLCMEQARVRDSLRHTLTAVRRRPLAPANVRHVVRLARVFIFYATPLRRHRERAKAVQRALRLRKD